MQNKKIHFLCSFSLLFCMFVSSHRGAARAPIFRKLLKQNQSIVTEPAPTSVPVVLFFLSVLSESRLQTAQFPLHFENSSRSFSPCGFVLELCLCVSRADRKPVFVIQFAELLPSGGPRGRLEELQVKLLSKSTKLRWD